ncbi:MAG: CBS domain-containing protein [Kofleriaceae bacterium]
MARTILDEEVPMKPSSPHPTATVVADTPLAEVMSERVIRVRASATLAEVRELLHHHRVGAVPVVDPDGRPIGVVSRTDLLTPSEGELPDDRSTCDQLMMPVVFTLGTSAPVGHAAALMAVEGVHRVFVVDDHGSLVGVVSALDVTRWLAARAGYLGPELVS